MSKRDANYYRELGSRGGRVTAERYGPEHMSEIGRRGHEQTTARYFAGNEALHNDFLRRMGQHVYWKSTSLPMRWDRSGQPIWPEMKPTHPAHCSLPLDQLAAANWYTPEQEAQLPW